VSPIGNWAKGGGKKGLGTVFARKKAATPVQGGKGAGEKYWPGVWWGSGGLKGGLKPEGGKNRW